VVISKSAVTENVKSVDHVRTINSVNKAKARTVSKTKIKVSATNKLAIGKTAVDATAVAVVVDAMVAMKAHKATIVTTPVSKPKTSALIQ
jgi:hypothetical protein